MLMTDFMDIYARRHVLFSGENSIHVSHHCGAYIFIGNLV